MSSYRWFTPVAAALFTAVLGAVIFGASACSSVDPYPTLVNRGVLPLSTNNPYVGSNLYLARQSELSSYLYNFMKRRGAPTAIEIIETPAVPHRLLMFYAREREVYAGELERQGKVWQWIVRGPFPLERDDYHAIVNLGASELGEPLFVIWGKEQRFRFDKRSQPELVVNVELPPPTPRPPTPVPKPKKKPHAPVITAPAEPTIPSGPMTLDQQALAMASGMATMNEKGDIVHTIKAGESLGAIAGWYTGATSNASTIAQYNGIDAVLPLPAGKKLSIPKDLVKNRKAMAQ